MSDGAFVEYHTGKRTRHEGDLARQVKQVAPEEMAASVSRHDSAFLPVVAVVFGPTVPSIGQ